MCLCASHCTCSVEEKAKEENMKITHLIVGAVLSGLLTCAMTKNVGCAVVSSALTVVICALGLNVVKS